MPRVAFHIFLFLDRLALQPCSRSHEVYQGGREDGHLQSMQVGGYWKLDSCLHSLKLSTFNEIETRLRIMTTMTKNVYNNSHWKLLSDVVNLLKFIVVRGYKY